MLFIHLSDASIQIIQTKRMFLGAERIVSCGRKDILPGYITDGVITDAEGVRTTISEILRSGHPRGMKDTHAAIIVPDKLGEIVRFSLQGNIKQKDEPSLVIEEAKKIMQHDPIGYENFYRIIGHTSSQRHVLYACLPTSTITTLGNFCEHLGLSLVFLSPASFALFELIHSLCAENQYVLFCGIEKKQIEFSVFDHRGVVLTHERALRSKTVASETKHFLDFLEKEHSVRPEKILLGGTYSLELGVQEITEKDHTSAVKISDVLDELLLHASLSLETGGVPRALYAVALGGLLLKKNPASANFARDLKLLRTIAEDIGAAHIGSSSTSSEDVHVEEDQIVEYSRSRLPIILAFFFGMLIVFLGVTFLLRSSAPFSLPFLSSPSPTASVTPFPSSSPTPTVDASLVRRDLSVLVQNGTSRSGYAGKTAAFLESKGYEQVSSSNADNADYSATVFRIKPDKRIYLPFLHDDLSSISSDPEVEELEEESDYDVVIVLGSE